MALYNTTNNKTLKRCFRQTGQIGKTLSFYKYHGIEDPKSFRDQLYINLDKLGVCGRIYVASEGINAQISVPLQSLQGFKDYIYSIAFLNGIRLNAAIENTEKSFFKLKILVRNKILADGLDARRFSVMHSGEHLNAASFNALTDDASTMVIDMRNHYESEIGHFKNAICPDADTFRSSIPLVEKILEGKKNQNIIMYCTGGIRCEKASAWFKSRGFGNVFQLDGGIIEYTKQVRALGIENKFIGKNFVFDERLGERISPDIISQCHQCGRPCDTHTNCKNDACHLLFIQCKACSNQFSECCSSACKDIINLPLEEQKKLRRGINKGRQVFKKGRSANIQKTLRKATC